MIQKFILCVAVITIISNSANGESENRGVAHARIQVFSLSIDFIACYCNRGQPVQCENNSISVSWSFHIELKTISLLVLGLIKRCYQCRSRGELGSCKDPFRYNASHVDAEPGVSTVPCASGWCGKVIEGTKGAFREDGKARASFT
jgi:hypothetical protein